VASAALVGTMTRLFLVMLALSLVACDDDQDKSECVK
jgi:hypothetical protein